jgi:Zn-finger nucleic acid-binding protein
MSAATLNCPMCGASASTASTKCDHCGARLATVACPSCFGMIFVGAKFCSHCGAKAHRTEAGAKHKQDCPRCRKPLEMVMLGQTEVCECPGCQGIWADKEIVEQVCADRDKQTLVLGTASALPPAAGTSLEKEIRYLPCPICKMLMHRVNFARCSAVIVDVCKAHGTWFDRDELRRVVEFLRAGGLEIAHAREIAELEERRRRLDNSVKAPPSFGFGKRVDDNLEAGISAAASALLRFLR